jgi:hypothetical protein
MVYHGFIQDNLSTENLGASMNRLALVTAFCLCSGLCQATFEIEDPAEPGKELINPANGKVFSLKKSAKKDLIIPPATALYLPMIEQEKCHGWRLDESETYLNKDNQTLFGSSKTYLGRSIKTIDCKDTNGTSLSLSLIQLEDKRLIWVDTNKTLSSR